MKRRLTAFILAVSLLFSFAVIIAYAENPDTGDINNDGNITAADARTALRVSAKLETLDETLLKVADVDASGSITAADARLILRVSAKLDSFATQSPETTTKAPETTTKTPETTTKTPETTTKAPEGDVTSDYPKAIDAFFSGNFFLDGVMVDGRNSVPLKLAISKSATEIALSVPNTSVQISIFAKGEKTYMKLSSGEKKHYADISGSLKEQLGNDFDDMMNQFTSINFKKPGDPVHTKAVYDGKECDVYSFDSPEAAGIKFIAVDNKIVQITMIDDKSVESNITVNELSDKIPENMLTIKGYEKSNILFIATLYPELKLS